MRIRPLLCVTAVGAAGAAIGCAGTFSTEPGQTSTNGDAAVAGGAPSTGGSGGAAGSGGTVAAGGSAGGVVAGGGIGTGGAPAAGGQPPVSPESGTSQPIDIELVITNNADDATWIGGDDERLVYSVDQSFDEVGADFEMGRAGFRFEPSIPPGSIIESAVLRLQHTNGDALETETMMVQVFDSSSVPQFGEDHVHGPAEHAAEGLWPILVSGFAVGTAGSRIDSPDLSVLVQHVVDRPDWTGQSSLGFVLTPDTLSTWVGIGDSASGSEGARMRITYRPPQR